jgi:hypothetical protein
MKFLKSTTIWFLTQLAILFGEWPCLLEKVRKDIDKVRANRK